MLRFAWKFSGQSRPPPEVVVFNQSVRSGPTETCLSISKNYPFQSFFAKKKSKIRSKRKWIASIRLETLFQSNNVVPFSLDNFTGFWLVRHGKQPSFRLHFLYLVYQCRWGSHAISYIPRVFQDTAMAQDTRASLLCSMPNMPHSHQQV